MSENRALEHHHSDILAAVREYLQQNKRDAKLFKKFEEGVCRGLSRLNFYVHQVQKRPKKTPDTQRDDLDWYKQTLGELLCRYNKKIPFPTDKSDPFYPHIERFIEYIIRFGNYASKLGFNADELRALEDVSEFKSEYELLAPLTANDFIKELTLNGKKTTLLDTLVHEGKITEIDAGNHATHLTKEKGVIYFFDANHETGERVPITGWQDFTANTNPIIKAHHTRKNKPLHFAFIVETLKEEEKEEKEIKTLASVTYPNVLDIISQLDYMRAEEKDRDSVNFVDPSTKNGITLLMHALALNNTELTKIYLDQNADVTKKDKAGCSVLFYATYSGKVELVRLILSERKAVEINEVNGKQRSSALTVATYANYPEIVDELIARGADVNIVDLDLNTPLHAAAIYDRNEIAAKLREAKANPNYTNSRGRTPLFYAVNRSNLDMVKLLLAHNADPTIKDSLGFSPLHLAMLVAYKNPNLKDFSILKLLGANDHLLKALATHPSLFSKFSSLVNTLYGTYLSYNPPPESVKTLAKTLVHACNQVVETGNIELAYTQLRDQVIEMANHELKTHHEKIFSFFRKKPQLFEQIIDALNKAKIPIHISPEGFIKADLTLEKAMNCIESFKRIIQETDFKNTNIIEKLQDELTKANPSSVLDHLQNLHTIAQTYLNQQPKPSNDTTAKFCDFVCRQAIPFFKKEEKASNRISGKKVI